MRLGGALRRAVEFRERERGAQFEAARFLPSGDADGGEEGLLCGRGAGGGLFEQDLAANAMEFGIVPTLSEALGFNDRSSDRDHGRVGISRL